MYCLGLIRSCVRPVLSLRVCYESKGYRIVVFKIRDCCVGGTRRLGHCATAIGSRGTLAAVLCFLRKLLLLCKAGLK